MINNSSFNTETDTNSPMDWRIFYFAYFVVIVVVVDTMMDFYVYYGG